MNYCKEFLRNMEEVDINQNLTSRKNRMTKDFNLMFTQHEALRRATLLKHRKVSTQLKLDMVQRQLSGLRRSVTDSDTDRQFYRSQMTELSNELQDLGSTLDKVERNAFYARKRVFRQCGMDFVSASTGAIPLSSSHPAIYSSSENLSRSTSRSSLKAKVCHLMSSPTTKFKKKHLFGELRAVASLSSLNIKSSSPSGHEEDNRKDSQTVHKGWKAPLRFLGNLVDSRFRRRLWGSTKRLKPEDNDVEQKSYRLSDYDIHKDINGFESSGTDAFGSSTSSSESNDEDEEDLEEEWKVRTGPKYVWKAPVARKVSNYQKSQVDPAILAEIDDFENMAAQYIKQHS